MDRALRKEDLSHEIEISHSIPDISEPLRGIQHKNAGQHSGYPKRVPEWRWCAYALPATTATIPGRPGFNLPV
jgi:hypothetical protein